MIARRCGHNRYLLIPHLDYVIVSDFALCDINLFERDSLLLEVVLRGGALHTPGLSEDG